MFLFFDIHQRNLNLSIKKMGKETEIKYRAQKNSFLLNLKSKTSMFRNNFSHLTVFLGKFHLISGNSVVSIFIIVTVKLH